MRCDFNRSMQHLVSKSREEDVGDDIEIRRRAPGALLLHRLHVLRQAVGRLQASSFRQRRVFRGTPHHRGRVGTIETVLGS
jgi:hypothetical protein